MWPAAPRRGGARAGVDASAPAKHGGGRPHGRAAGRAGGPADRRAGRRRGGWGGQARGAARGARARGRGARTPQEQRLAAEALEPQRRLEPVAPVQPALQVAEVGRLLRRLRRRAAVGVGHLGASQAAAAQIDGRRRRRRRRRASGGPPPLGAGRWGRPQAPPKNHRLPVPALRARRAPEASLRGSSGRREEAQRRREGARARRLALPRPPLCGKRCGAVRVRRPAAGGGRQHAEGRRSSGRAAFLPPRLRRALPRARPHTHTGRTHTHTSGCGARQASAGAERAREHSLAAAAAAASAAASPKPNWRLGGPIGGCLWISAGCAGARAAR